MSAASPEDTVFCVLSFEGPDAYSLSGGLGTRVKELVLALAGRGFETHLYFTGDPALPAEEVRAGVHYHRWSQWLSRHHPQGVYAGEEAKVDDWVRSLPLHLIETLVEPAARRGQRVVVMAEEWQTASTLTRLAQALWVRGLRGWVVALWNANNLYGFDRVDFRQLASVALITTVSRYMKHRMWAWSVNPVVIPNGIPAAWLKVPPAASVKALRAAGGPGFFGFKIGRFDPDKRWLMAVSAAALLKRRQGRVKLLIRGGPEAHGAEVLGSAVAEGLSVVDAPAPATAAGLARLLRAHPEADLLNLTSYVPEAVARTVYAAADAVLANSGHEPFGLVGLEVMSAGGLAVTGATGEDYALAYRNAIVI